MTQLYFGLNRGANQQPEAIVFTSGSSGGTDVELRVDNTKGLTREDVFLILEAFDRYFQDTSKTTLNSI
jgi:hypothetical protein